MYQLAICNYVSCSLSVSYIRRFILAILLLSLQLVYVDMIMRCLLCWTHQEDLIELTAQLAVHVLSVLFHYHQSVISGSFHGLLDHLHPMNKTHHTHLMMLMMNILSGSIVKCPPTLHKWQREAS